MSEQENRNRLIALIVIAIGLILLAYALQITVAFYEDGSFELGGCLPWLFCGE